MHTLVQCQEHAKCQQLEFPSNPQGMIHGFHIRLQSQGNVDPHSSLAGRRNAISDERLLAIIDKLRNYRAAGERLPYATIDTLVEKDPEVAA